MTGRFAPSPTGTLHVGNLRTALLAWLVARSSAGRFVLRMEDLDRANSSPAHEARQLADLRAIGLDWDGPVVRQSERFEDVDGGLAPGRVDGGLSPGRVDGGLSPGRVDGGLSPGRYSEAISGLRAGGLVYECFCTRREISEAIAAPHGPQRGYPGTCRHRPPARVPGGRPPALRLRSSHEPITFDDALAGPFTGPSDDVVLRRNDGVPAYNLAVVVDDAGQGVDEVVRGDDLLPSTPPQIHLQHLLGLPPVRYVHVPLVVGADGQRLAKRHGAVTLADLAATGVPVRRVVSALGLSLGLPAGAERASDLLDGFDLGLVRAVGRAPVALADLQRSWS